MVEFLKDKFANTGLKSDMEKSPVQIAEERGHAEIVKLLKEDDRPFISIINTPGTDSLLPQYLAKKARERNQPKVIQSTTKKPSEAGTVRKVRGIKSPNQSKLETPKASIKVVTSQSDSNRPKTPKNNQNNVTMQSRPLSGDLGTKLCFAASSQPSFLVTNKFQGEDQAVPFQANGKTPTNLGPIHYQIAGRMRGICSYELSPPDSAGGCTSPNSATNGSPAPPATISPNGSIPHYQQHALYRQHPNYRAQFLYHPQSSVSSSTFTAPLQQHHQNNLLLQENRPSCAMNTSQESQSSTNNYLNRLTGSGDLLGYTSQNLTNITPVQDFPSTVCLTPSPENLDASEWTDYSSASKFPRHCASERSNYFGKQ